MYRLADEGIVRVAVGVEAGGRRVGDAVETGKGVPHRRLEDAFC